mmetsp:Transcript_10408/g.23556  ORF Transcript_10408/g.23556 Transcript_10408/m.23556 type:complete len:465 (-) Transcript_10408:128-1522(-)
MPSVTAAVELLKKPEVRHAIANPLTTLWTSFTKPKRDTYTEQDLGPSCFYMKTEPNIRVVREDLQLKNERGHVLECSYWCPLSKRGVPIKGSDLCVLHLHGLGSSRCDAWSILEATVRRGLSLCAFDFSGSGLSGGEYCSLGYHEQNDAKVVIEYLRESGRATAIALWGRSMGAATAIFRASKDPTLAACVLDSPFSDFLELAGEIANSTQVPVPRAMVRMLLRSVRKDVMENAGFDVMEHAPLKSAPSAKVPAWFCTGTKDDFILPRHSEVLHEAWGCSKRKLTYLNDQDHRSRRPSWFHEQALDFVIEMLQQAAEAQPCVSAPKPPKGQPPKGQPPKDSPDVSAGGCPPTVDSDAMFERTLQRQRRLRNEADGSAGASPDSELPAEETLRRTLRNVSLLHLQAPGGGAGEEAGEKSDQNGGTKSIEAQLLDLGVSPSSAAKAVARCSSIEGAVEWLDKNGLL